MVFAPKGDAVDVAPKPPPALKPLNAGAADVLVPNILVPVVQDAAPNTGGLAWLLNKPPAWFWEEITLLSHALCS